VELRPTIHDPALRAFALTNIEAVSTNHGGSSAVVKTLQKPMLRWKVNLNAIQQQLHVLAGFDYHYKSEDDLLLENEIRYHGDTYFILGGQSKFVRNSYIPTISNHFPNYMMTTIKGSGHWVHSEAPDDTLLLLKRYLDR
jgi:pimeloyl-ACP methyl ester carboxylesterase